MSFIDGPKFILSIFPLFLGEQASDDFLSDSTATSTKENRKKKSKKTKKRSCKRKGKKDKEEEEEEEESLSERRKRALLEFKKQALITEQPLTETLVMPTSISCKNGSTQST